jgi:hypothetical protein
MVGTAGAVKRLIGQYGKYATRGSFESRVIDGLSLPGGVKPDVPQSGRFVLPQIAGQAMMGGRRKHVEL